MKAVIVLAMHGVPPNDFPEPEMAELFSLRARVKKVAGPERLALEGSLRELDSKMRAWPRTAKNDPFCAASQELGASLKKATGCEVVVGFNEFCGPSLDDALRRAIASGAEKVIVVTPMMTRGGEHAEVDIPAVIKAVQAEHPEFPIVYAWPFKVSETANFLASHIADLL